MMLTVLMTAATIAGGAPPKSCSAVSAVQQAALVELFTSQGCSSCPPADRWLSQLPQRYPRAQVVPIALHVSYWDYIGWKDPYARAEFNQRQRDLAAASGSATVYTPGVFLQGQELAHWSVPSRFDAAVGSIVAAPADARISLTATVVDDALTVTPSAVAFRSAREPRLYLALVENELATRVRAGENRGETLRNDRVVRQWSGPLPLAGAPVRWTLPPAAPLARYAVVGFVQEAAPGGRVLQAVDLSLASC